jgi:hypothetical protein
MYTIYEKCIILLGKLVTERPVGGQRCRQENNGDVAFKGKGCGLMYLAPDRAQWRALMNTVMNLRDP